MTIQTCEIVLRSQVLCKTVPYKTRGPWATSLTWENSLIKKKTYDYHNVNWKKKKPIIYFLRIEWFFIWTNLNPLHPRMLCTKFVWNWPMQWFWRRRFFFYFVNVFLLFGNYLPLKNGGALHLEKLENSFTQGCFVPSLVEIRPLVQETKILKFRQCIFAIW